MTRVDTIMKLFPVKPSNTPDAYEVRSIVERAWYDNVVAAGYDKCQSAAPWMKAAFTHRVEKFVREYFRKTGRYPFGAYDLNDTGHKIRFGLREVSSSREISPVASLGRS